MASPNDESKEAKFWETETEAKAKYDAKIPPGDFQEQFQGIKKLERKGGLNEKPKENIYYIVNKSVTNIYVDIIKKFVKENKKEIFNGNDYQTLTGKNNHLLHVESGLPTFRGKVHKHWNDKIDYLENNIERFKVSFLRDKTHSNQCDEAFSEARKKLLDEAVKSMLYAFQEIRSSIEPRKTGVQINDVIEASRNQLLKDTEIEQLGKNIETIIYSDIKEMPYGVFVDRQVLNLWKEEGGSMKEFFDFTEKVREMFHKLPEFVVRWGEWAYRAFDKLNSP